MLSSSFKISGEVLQYPIRLIPDKIIFTNFTDLFGDPYYDFGRWYMNTAVMTVTTILLKVFKLNFRAET